MADSYPYLSGVRSNLIEDQIKTEQLPPSANTILVFGTAQKGPLLTPTRMTPATAESIFGENVNDPYQRFNLLKGFYEIVGSMPGTEVIGVRIGNAKKSKLELFESQVASGVYSPQASETVSLTLEAKTEGLEGNDIVATIYDNGRATDPTPSRMVIELPNGISQDFDLVNDYPTPAALAAAINSNSELATYMIATTNVLEGSDSIEILEGVSSGIIQTEYDLSERDIIDITAVYTQGSYVDKDSIQPGRSSVSLAKTPIKDTSALTATIDKFWTVILSETTLSNVGPGINSAILAKATGGAEADPKWIPAQTDSIKDLVVKKRNSSGVLTTLTLTTDYTINQTTGVVSFVSELDPGDSIVTSYKYLTTYTEANVRSNIQVGNIYSYFVSGSDVIFGAGQPYPLEVSYKTKTTHSLASVNLEEGSITLSLDGNQPTVDPTNPLIVEYVFNPELPAATGSIATPAGKRQLSQLSGGSDGRKLTLPELYNQLQKAYVAADNVPCRIVIPQGVYVDDVMEGLDFETGLPTTVNAGFHTQLLTFANRHSQYVSECYGVMSVRPMSTANPASPSFEERESWYKNLVTISATKPTIAANVVAAINDFHLIVSVGDFIMSHPNVFGGTLYVEGGHNILGAMKLNHDNLTSIVTRTVPSSIVRGMQYKIVSSDKVNKLIEYRYTLFTEDSDTGNLKIAAAPTMAAPTSQFRRQYNLDITIEAIEIVRRNLKRFIGQPNKPSVRQAMKRLAEQKLQEISPDKILSAQINVITDYTDAINGKVMVELTIVTAVEIQTITIRTRLELGF